MRCAVVGDIPGIADVRLNIDTRAFPLFASTGKVATAGGIEPAPLDSAAPRRVPLQWSAPLTLNHGAVRSSR